MNFITQKTCTNVFGKKSYAKLLLIGQNHFFKIEQIAPMGNSGARKHLHPPLCSIPKTLYFRVTHQQLAVIAARPTYTVNSE